MVLTRKTYDLDQNAVDTVSGEIQDYLNSLKIERRSVQEIRLMVEDMLLNILEHNKATREINIEIGKQFGRHILRLYYSGESFDPVKYNENVWPDEMMRHLGYSPSWSYKRGVNTVSLVLAEKVRRSKVFYLIIAALAASVLGWAGYMIPETTRHFYEEVLLTPIAKSFLGIMKTFSGLMIALTICSGILGIGDSMSLGKMGKRILLRFTGLSFLVCILVLAISVSAFSLPFSLKAQAGSSQSEQISKMIFDILPSDPVSPFHTGNTLQIIVIAVFVGIGLIAIGERGKRIRNLINEGTALTQHIVSLICGFIPLFVFVMLLRLNWSNNDIEVFSVWKPLALTLGCELILTLVIWLAISAYLKCPPMTLMRKVFPLFVVAFTTASSMAAMPLCMETCEKKLGIQRSLLSFAYPIGSVIYMPAGITYFTVIVCFFAGKYQLDISCSWLITAAISVTLLVIAMPPIPGAGMLVYTILFAQLGIPEEAMVLVVATDVIMDFCNTGVNVLLLNMQMASEAASLNCMDKSVLMNKSIS